MQRRPLKKGWASSKVIVLDFLGVLSTITHTHYIKSQREARQLEGTRGSILKGPVLTMFKYLRSGGPVIEIDLAIVNIFLLIKSSLLPRSAKNFNDIEFKLRERT